MKNTWYLLLVLLVLLGIGASRFGSGAPYSPRVKNGECWRHWVGAGFSSRWDHPTKKTYLFHPSGKESYTDFYRRLDRSQCWKQWLVIVYMAADNDLSPYAFRDLWEMEAEGSSQSVDIVVFLDDAQTRGGRYFHMAKRSTRFDYKAAIEAFVRKNRLQNRTTKEKEEAFLKEYGPRSFRRGRGLKLVQSPVVSQVEEPDSGSTATAGRFLSWALQAYPAKRVALIGWSHGEGFDSEVKSKNLKERNPKRERQPGRQGGFAFDYTSKSHMKVTAMSRGTKLLLRRYRGGKNIDIAGSDACLNQQIEFGYEWIGVADYVFGSSTIVQEKGFNYRTLLELFNENPLRPTEFLAGRIPSIYGASVSAGSGHTYGGYYDPFGTMATWKTPKLIPMKQSLENLGRWLNGYLSAPKKEADKIRRILEMYRIIKKTKRLGSVSNDLKNFLHQLTQWGREKWQNANAKEKPSWAAFARLIQDTNTKLRDSVLAKFVGKRVKFASYGVAVWLPTSEQEYRDMFPKFRSGKFYQGQRPNTLTQWGRFISKLYELD